MGKIMLSGLTTKVSADVALIKSQDTLVLNEKKCKSITIDGLINEFSFPQFIHHTSLSSTLLRASLLLNLALNDSQQKRCRDPERDISRLDLIMIMMA